MYLKNYVLLIFFIFLVACETGAKEEEKPNELTKEFSEKFNAIHQENNISEPRELAMNDLIYYNIYILARAKSNIP